MKTIREIVIWFIIGGLVGAAGGLAINIIHDVKKINTLEKKMQMLRQNGDAP